MGPYCFYIIESKLRNNAFTAVSSSEGIACAKVRFSFTRKKGQAVLNSVKHGWEIES